MGHGARGGGCVMCCTCDTQSFGRQKCPSDTVNTRDMDKDMDKDNVYGVLHL